jgi:hypothetical protein
LAPDTVDTIHHLAAKTHSEEQHNLWIYRYVDSSPCLIDRKGSKQLKLIRVVSQSCRTGHGYANVMCTGNEKKEESITVGGLKDEF